MSSPLYLSANGARVTAADVLVPYYGAPVADLVFPSSLTLTSPVSLVVGNLKLCMTVIRQASFAGGATARLVGGAGGWGLPVLAQAYSNPAGVPQRLILGDVAGLVGERVQGASSASVGLFFVREAAPAARVLRQLVGGLWWIDVTGVTQVGASARSTRKIKSPATVADYSGGKGLLTVATEDPAAWMPGATYSGNTVLAPITVSATRIRSGEDGTLRLEVLTT